MNLYKSTEKKVCIYEVINKSFQGTVILKRVWKTVKS